MWFQQYGAISHTSRGTFNLLDGEFICSIISYHVDVNRTPRPHFLKPLFLLWSRLYQQTFNVGTPKNNQLIAEVIPVTHNKVIENYLQWINCCKMSKVVHLTDIIFYNNWTIPVIWLFKKRSIIFCVFFWNGRQKTGNGLLLWLLKPKVFVRQNYHSEMWFVGSRYYIEIPNCKYFSLQQISLICFYNFHILPGLTIFHLVLIPRFGNIIGFPVSILVWLVPSSLSG